MRNGVGSIRTGAWTVARVVRSPKFRFLVFAVLLATCTWFAVHHGTGALEAARHWAAGLGIAGAVGFTAVYALSATALLPATILSTAAGALYGPAGILVVWTGAIAGAAASFVLGRRLGRRAVEELAGSRLDRIDAFLRHRGFAAVLLVRLIPLFPFAVVNYGAALTAVGFRHYLAATALGTVPAATAYVMLGDSLDDPTSLPFVLATTALVLLAGLGTLTARRLRSRDGTPQECAEAGESAERVGSR